jgi:putative peptidoglycan lipid II flippase
MRPVVDTASAHVRTVVRSFLPAFVGRGAYQLSAYADMWLASKVAEGAVAALGYAQNVYMLPVSRFGMAVSAAELPAMSSASGVESQISGYLRTRLDAGLRQIAFFVVPSAMAFAALGQVIAGVLYHGGRFGNAQSRYVWVILAGSAVGLLASTLGRLYSSTYYALKDTRTPLRFALVRVALTIALGYLAALVLPGLLGIDRRFGAAGLTASAGIAGWVEFALLRSRLNRRIGRTGLPAALLARLWLAALIAAGAGWGVLRLLRGLPPRPAGIVVLGTFGLVYVLVTYAAGVPQAKTFLGRLVK